MNIFNADKIMNRLDKMIDNAIDGNPIENGYDETKMSALETKLSRYLAMTGSNRDKLASEKSKINELVSDISHQTKTPIANILLYSQLLGEADLPDKDKLCIKSLMEQAEKLNFLITSLVKMSRLETGIISVSPKLQQIQPMINSVLAQVTSKADSSHIMLTNKQTDSNAIFDLKWTSEAIYNIVDNALKYTQAEGSVSVSVISYQLFCRIDITDTGIGISENEIPKVFSRFYRSSTVNEKEGVGIGLYLAREIITSQSGYIKVRSKVGKGSTFSIFLPMQG